MPIHLTPAKAAILLGTSDRTVRSLIHRRLLCATPVGSRLNGRNGPARYEISLEDLQATGLPLDLTRLPLLASMSRRAKDTAPEHAVMDDASALLQTLKEEQIKVQALRVEMERTIQEMRRQLARLEATDADRALPQPSPTPGHALDVSPHPRVGNPRAALIEGPPSGLMPLWLPDFGARIRHNVEQHLLVIDNSIVALTPTEYRLVIEIFAQYAQWLPSNQVEGFWLDLARLQQVLDHASPQLLRKHIRKMNPKLAPFGVRVQWVRGMGYTLVLAGATLRGPAGRHSKEAPQRPLSAERTNLWRGTSR